MTTPRVYIPSRGRWENVPKLLKAWDDCFFDVKFMVEPDEVEKYESEIPKQYARMVEVLALPDRNLGVGYSRTLCLLHADNDGFESIICSDDDIKPNTGRSGDQDAGMDGLVDLAGDPMVLGATAYYSYQDLMLGIKGGPRKDVIIAPSCIVRMFGLNVKNSLEIGGFDSDLKCGDDADFMIRGVIAGYPWLIDLAAKAISFAPRFAVGGVEALEKDISTGEVKGAKGDATRDAVRIISEKFPEIANPVRPDKLSYKWRKLYDDNLPDWKHWSPLHGGNIRNYLGEDWQR
jgi:hypothetical protein